jgi:hypothetical protein
LRPRSRGHPAVRQRHNRDRHRDEELKEHAHPHLGTTETGPSATMTTGRRQWARPAGWSGFARLGLSGAGDEVQGSSMSGFAAR